MIIAFEGHVCAGKTTTSTMLSSSDGIFVMREYMELLSQEEMEDFSNLLSIDKFKFLLYLDIKRNSILYENNLMCIMDRCAFCFYAYEYAVAKLNSVQINKSIVDSIYKHDFLFPDKIVYFSVSDEIQKRRYGKRKGEVSSIFLKNDFNKYIKEFYINLSRNLDVIFIDTTNMNEKEVYTVVKILLSQEPVFISREIIRSFLIELIKGA